MDQRFLIVCVLIILSLLSVVTDSRPAPECEKFPALIVFGASYCDAGNNNNLVTLAKANFPPNGKDFMGGIPTGRFSNGKVLGDVLAKKLSIKEYLPAYLDPNLQPADLTSGVTFASSASGYDNLTSTLGSAMSVSKQLQLFEEYQMKLHTIVGENQTNYILGHAVYTVVFGINDLTFSYYGSGIRKLQYENVSSYIDMVMIKSAVNLFENLYAMGARRVCFFNIPPVGCFPERRTRNGGVNRDCAENYNEASALFNSKLSLAVNSLNKKYHDAKVVVGDLYSPLLDLIQNPKRKGFEVVDRGCCGTGLVEVGLTCNSLLNPNLTTCPDASKYVFWDTIHPTEAAHKYLISKNIDNIIDKLT